MLTNPIPFSRHACLQWMLREAVSLSGRKAVSLSRREAVSLTRREAVSLSRREMMTSFMVRRLF